MKTKLYPKKVLVALSDTDFKILQQISENDSISRSEAIRQLLKLTKKATGLRPSLISFAKHLFQSKKVQ